MHQSQVTALWSRFSFLCLAPCNLYPKSCCINTTCSQHHQPHSPIVLFCLWNEFASAGRAHPRACWVVLKLVLMHAYYITSLLRHWLRVNSSALRREPQHPDAKQRCFKQPHHGHHLLTFKYIKPHVHKAVHVGVRVFFFLHWRLVSTMAESEADTPSTPIEFESKYFEFDGVRLPPFCRGKMEEIANFSLRSSDIWIVTYPKSGKRATTPPCARVSSCLRISCCSLLQQFLQASLVIIKV